MRENLQQHGLIVNDVADGVVALSSGPGTLGTSNSALVIRGRTAVVVDCFLLPSMARGIEEVARSRGVSIVAVYNTHPHIDHVGGNAAFGPHVPVVSLPQTVSSVSRLAADTGFLPRLFPDHATELENLTLRVPSVLGEPLSTAVRAHPAGAAHTPADLVVEVLGESHVVIAGDLCFNGVTPMALPGHADLHGWRRALETLMVSSPDVVIPGHGIGWGPDALHSVHGWLGAILEVAEDVVAEGLSGPSAMRVAVHRFAGTDATAGWVDAGRARFALTSAITDLTGDTSIVDPGIPRASGRPGAR